MSLKTIVIVSLVVVVARADHPVRRPAHSPPAPSLSAPSYPTYPGPAPSNPSHSLPASTPHSGPQYPDGPPRYSYEYGVADDKSGANFGHSESRDGYKTEGSYTVDLPDGRTKTVNYIDIGDGLKADVTIEGNRAPTYNPSPSYNPAPSYKPAPSYG